ncbi:MAG: hypothetical protein ACI9FB_004558 [Candidatus Azotimanducaceae bacterium]|jgi:hypothetical protein
MSPEFIGIIIGAVFVMPTIYFVHKNQFDAWAWPIFLTTLPLYYMMFGLLVMDGRAILNELLFGLPYFITGLLAWRYKSALTHYALGLAWLSHGFYDYYHDILFVNPGVFTWYPAFCALVDISVAAYLLLKPKVFQNQHL